MSFGSDLLFAEDPSPAIILTLLMDLILKLHILDIASKVELN
jgi:hypothetical protein